MSLLNIFINCIILLVGHQGVFPLPTADVTDLTTARIDSSSKSPCGKEAPCGQTYTRNVIMHGTVCSCNLGMRGILVRDDYRHTPGIGSHKLHTRAERWNEARKICNEEGGHLAIINSFAEAHVLMDLFNRSGPIKGSQVLDEAFVGIHDLYAEGDWVTVLDESLAKTGYAEWSDKWGGQPDNGGGVQNCGGFLREGGLDDLSCSIPVPFFCEIPEMRVL
ncbi:hemolymph lipopolysaccharide-binding protein-like [Calliopsis andreniformis]|uniref:hemolymph lipopolysaccharide-binding protein-like n=1 Tax=Calliopsis andreniformis TaxID=337506 RepID=UPI003FCE0B92